MPNMNPDKSGKMSNGGCGCWATLLLAVLLAFAVLAAGIIDVDPRGTGGYQDSNFSAVMPR